MAKTAYTALPEVWQEWLVQNFSYRYDDELILRAMVRHGGFDRRFAAAAIEEARIATAGPQTARPLPFIDTTTNTIRTADREVQVLMSLQSPRLVLLGNVLSDEECDALCRLAEPRLERSTMLSNDGSGKREVNTHRTSDSTFFFKGDEPLVNRIDARLAELSNWPEENGEAMQIARYTAGGEFKTHYDWFSPQQPGSEMARARGGQRVGTFLIYLTDIEEGGATAFTMRGLEVRPRKGNALFFVNTDEFGMPDKNTLHAGLPVGSGVKFIANKWLRETECRTDVEREILKSRS
jgi:prolyl 4-hydroxylase